MGKTFAQRLRKIKQDYFNAGMETGMQLALDSVAVVLNDPDVMGKNTYSRDRLAKVLTACAKDYDSWRETVMRNNDTRADESDALRQRLDAKLEKALGEYASLPFDTRYPFIEESRL